MANGKGSLSCSHYCKHYGAKENFCDFHKVKIPLPKHISYNTICVHFDPTKNYAVDTTIGEITIPYASYFSSFGMHMEPGKLYEFPYNMPSAIEESSTLCMPDWQNGKWRVIGDKLPEK